MQFCLYFHPRGIKRSRRFLRVGLGTVQSRLEPTARQKRACATDELFKFRCSEDFHRCCRIAAHIKARLIASTLPRVRIIAGGQRIRSRARRFLYFLFPIRPAARSIWKYAVRAGIRRDRTIEYNFFLVISAQYIVENSKSAQNFSNFVDPTRRLFLDFLTASSHWPCRRSIQLVTE